MRIGIDARMYGPRQTGIGVYIESLINELSKIDKENYYHIFLLSEEYKKFQLPTNNFSKIEVNSHWYSFKEQIIFLKKITKEKLDLMHFTHFNFPIFYPSKFVITIHDITPKFVPGHKMGKSWYRRKAYDLMLKKGITKSDSVIVPSEVTKKDLINYYEAKKNKIQVIYEGIKNKKTAEERKEFINNYSQNKEVALKKLKEKYGMKSLRKPYVFYVGVWREHKNLINLIRAFSLLVKKHSFEGQLVLGGAPSDFYSEIKKEWRASGLAGKVVIPGFLVGEKLELLYEAADLFVLPSLYEGFGLVPLEALNNGTVAACSDISVLREVTQNKAIYFNPNNPEEMARKMNDILRNKRSQVSLLRGSQKVIDSYNWKKMADEIHEIYINILKS